jgi:SAM-dependent methyltransferase
MIDFELLRCPDCGDSFNSRLRCCQCGRQVQYRDGYYDLLPVDMSAPKRNEDRIFERESAEWKELVGRPWRKLIGRLEIERFEREILPELPVGNFLELAGESCWAAAIYKSVHPSARVIATDVSRNAIVHLAIPLGSMFPHNPDVYATVDAETLPFQDETLDCIFIESAMHHLPEPVTMLRETKRVLAPGGRFVAVDHCVPPHFRFLFSSVAQERAKTYGIQEDLVSFHRWRAYFRQAGLPESSLRVYDNPSYLRNPIFALAGRAISIFPNLIKRTLFPVGLYVVYDKH